MNGSEAVYGVSWQGQLSKSGGNKLKRENRWVELRGTTLVCYPDKPAAVWDMSQEGAELVLEGDKYSVKGAGKDYQFSSSVSYQVNQLATVLERNRGEAQQRAGMKGEQLTAYTEQLAMENSMLKMAADAMSDPEGMRGMADRLAAASAINEELQGQIMKLQKQLEEKEADIIAASRAAERNSDRLSNELQAARNLTGAHEGLQSTVAEKTDQLAQAEDKLSSLAEQVAGLEKTVDELNADVSAKSKENAALETRVQSLSEHADSTAEAQSQKLSDATAEIEELKSEAKKLTEGSASLEAKAKDLEKELADAKGAKASADEELASAQAALENTKVELETAQKSKRDVELELAEAKSAAAVEKEELTAAADDAKEASDAQKADLEGAIAEKTDQLAQAEDKLSSLAEQVAGLEKTVDELNADVSAKSKENAALETRVQSLSEHADSTAEAQSQKLSDATAEIEELKVKANDLEEELADAKGAKASADEELASAQAALEEAKTAAAAEKEEHRAAMDSVSRLEAELDDEVAERQHTAEALAVLTTLLAEKKDEVAELHEQADLQARDADAATSHGDVLRQEVALKQSHIDHITAKNTALSSKCEELESSVAAHVEEIAGLNKQVEGQASEIQRHSDAAGEASAKADGLSAELQDRNEKVECLEAQLSGLKEAAQQMADAEKEIQTGLMSAQGCVSQLEARVAELEEDLKDSRESAEKMQAELSELELLRPRLVEQEEKSKDAANEVEALNAAISSLNERLVAAADRTSDADDLQKKLNEARESIAGLTAQLDEMKHLKEALDVQVAALEKERDATNAANAVLERRMNGSFNSVPRAASQISNGSIVLKDVDAATPDNAAADSGSPCAEAASPAVEEVQAVRDMIMSELMAARNTIQTLEEVLDDERAKCKQLERGGAHDARDWEKLKSENETLTAKNKTLSRDITLLSEQTARTVTESSDPRQRFADERGMWSRKLERAQEGLVKAKEGRDADKERISLLEAEVDTLRVKLRMETDQGHMAQAFDNTHDPSDPNSIQSRLIHTFIELKKCLVEAQEAFQRIEFKHTIEKDADKELDLVMKNNVVDSVHPNGSAEAAGVRAGMVVHTVNGSPFKSFVQVQQAMQAGTVELVMREAPERAALRLEAREILMGATPNELVTRNCNLRDHMKVLAEKVRVAQDEAEALRESNEQLKLDEQQRFEEVSTTAEQLALIEAENAELREQLNMEGKKPEAAEPAGEEPKVKAWWGGMMKKADAWRSVSSPTKADEGASLEKKETLL
eukprot:TRINITY_DN1481_c0_g1_i1.p1 TRINITY_DN1481_c0_g1~~TRINITY_DN1481_c0_g1_i1.p1  ORF type:complete len:1276 (+),score=398.67 TRINITY_DN1481_c0_g1_i1:49-3876(+)